MTQRTLTANELEEILTEDGTLHEEYKNISSRMRNGEKIIPKLKETASGIKIVIYVYDKNLYRYVKEKETQPFGI